MPITQHGSLARDDNDTPVMGGTSSADNATIINASFDPVTRRLLVDATGGGGLTKLTATGTVDGSNQNFAFASLPNFIVSDGIWLEQLDSNANVQWSWNIPTLTAHLSVPPYSSIYGF